ncbi:MAG: antibiotic biosynthesis monooxygenase [Bacteroidota bacterium]
MSKPIYVVAELTAQEGKFDEMNQIFQALANESRKEPGAVEYFFIEDQSKPNTLLSIEKWENETEESKHWQTPHLAKALEQAKEVLSGEPTIHKGFQVI